MIRGDIVAFASPMSGEEQDRFVILEVNGDRGFGQALGTGLSIPPVSLLRIADLKRVGHAATAALPDAAHYSEKRGIK